MSSPSEIERESLEAHVELCAIRYNNLETKIDNLEARIDKLDVHLVDIKNSLMNSNLETNKQTMSIVVKIMGILLASLIGFIGSGIFK